MDTREYSRINDRIKILNCLMNFSKPLDSLSNQLKKLSWDYDGIPVIITIEHLLNVLDNYVAQKITAKQVEDWANLIECREDIDYEEINKERIINTIFSRLANPELEGQLNIEECIMLINELKN